MHDAALEWRDVRFEPESGVVSVPLAQEAGAAFNLPGKRLIRTGRLGWKVYEVPYVRCEVRIANACDLVVDEDGRDEPGELNAVEVEGDVVHVYAHLGPDLRISVTKVEMELVVTDEIVFRSKRREHRLLGSIG